MYVDGASGGQWRRSPPLLFSSGRAVHLPLPPPRQHTVLQRDADVIWQLLRFSCAFATAVVVRVVDGATIQCITFTVAFASINLMITLVAAGKCTNVCFVYATTAHLCEAGRRDCSCAPVVACGQHVHIKKSTLRLWRGDTKESLQNTRLRFQQRLPHSFYPLGVSPFRSVTKSERFTHNSCVGSASLRTHRSASASSSRCAASGSAPHNISVF